MCARVYRPVSAALFLCLFLPAFSSADELLLKDGSKLIGTLVWAQDGVFTFDTGFAGKLTIKVQDVETISTAETVTLLLDDGTLLENEQLSGNSGGRIAATTLAAPVQLASIHRINPARWELGHGYRWTGKAYTTLEFERGNADTDEWQLDAEGEWLSVRDRILARAHWEQEESNGIKVQDQWRLEGNYDYFLKNPDNFVGAQLMLEADEFADLDLRTRIGALFGRQFSSSPKHAVRGSLGIAYVDEKFDVADDNDYAAATWTLQADSNILGGNRKLYLRHDGSIDVTESDNLIVNTRIGISMPVYGGFEAAAELGYEYDGAAPAGIDDLDETLNFRLGYSW